MENIKKITLLTLKETKQSNLAGARKSTAEKVKFKLFLDNSTLKKTNKIH